MKIMIDGYEILIDKSDKQYLNKKRYRVQKKEDRYYLISDKPINNKTTIYRLHREIMKCPKNMIIDHINGNGLDNRKCNLRICTNAENIRNQKIHKNNTSGFKGVSFRKKYKTWRSQIKYENKKIHLGSFKTAQEAYKVYCNAAIKYHGEFARFA